MGDGDPKFESFSSSSSTPSEHDSLVAYEISSPLLSLVYTFALENVKVVFLWLLRGLVGGV